MVIDKIIDSGLIQENAAIVVGVSGGPDSLCLLHSLVQISEPYNLTIVPVHVNHKLRPSADDEAMNVARICEILDLECLIFEADCEAMAKDLGISTEEAGRYIRYDIFDDVANDLKEQGWSEESICIAVAHNADDQSETVLFRLLRGTGVHGLAGIPEIRPSDEGFMIIRPLLRVPRSEIEEYIKENNLRPNMDETNEGTDYARNRIRNELIPYIEKNFNPNIKDALRRYAEIADVDDSLIEEIAYSDCADALTADDEKDALILDISEIKENPPAINRRIVAIVLRSLRLDTKSSYELVIAILNLIYNENPSAQVDLPNGYKAIREYDQVVFTDNKELFTAAKPEENVRLLVQIVPKKGFKPEDGAIYAAYDFDKFNEVYPGRAGEITLRTRQEGDWIAIKAEDQAGFGRKKIQDFFVDTKIPKNDRDAVLMACIDNEVLWVCGNRFSQNFQINDTTERVLFLEVEAEF